MLKQLFAASAIALLPLVSSPAMAEDSKLARTIVISGHGEVRAAPDFAILSLGVFKNAPTAKEALDANTEAMNAVIAALKAAGIDAKDIQTSNFMVNPRYDYQNDGSASTPISHGFDVSNTVTVIVKQLGDVGRILDQAVSAGANQVNSISFGLKKAEMAMDEARKFAVIEAKRKADLLAQASGVTLGNIVTINEGGDAQPQPQFMMREAAGAAKDVPIAQGQQVISSDVTIIWEIK
jgi:uncharacterized protein